MRQNKRVRSACAVLCGGLLLLGLMTQSAQANSAQTHWRGSDAAGAFVTGEGSPILVEREQLTFEIDTFPPQRFQTVGDVSGYTGRVTAEYTFCNPSEQTVDAVLAFPFGVMPDYAYDMEERMLSDTTGYQVTVDGQSIRTRLRHTLSFYGEQFELEKDLARLHDGYMQDEFYSPDMPVTQYIYEISGVDTQTYRAATVAVTMDPDPDRSRVLLEQQSGGRELEGAVQLQAWVDSGEELVLNVIGEPFEGVQQWCIYENGACEDPIEGMVIPAGRRTITLRDYLLSEYDPGSGVLESDWYNAVLTSMKHYQWSHGVINANEVEFDISRQLMRWYEYELTLQPGQRLVNTVCAPIYPAVRTDYDPSVYTYTYLLSPAQTWSEFGQLDIDIHTPFFLLESTQEGFEQTQQGYALSLEGLPEGELTFTLCAKENPKGPVRGYAPPGIWLLGATVIAGGAAIAAVLYRKGKK